MTKTAAKQKLSPLKLWGGRVELLIIVLLALFLLLRSPLMAKDLKPEEFQALRKASPDLIVLDVRTAEEYRAGHIPGAINIELNNLLKGQLGPIEGKESDEIFVYCLSGSRSRFAQRYLQARGYSQIYNLPGGIGTYTKAGYPLEK